MKINGSMNFGLRMNFSVSDKHWTMYASYFSNGPALLSELNSLDAQGYGFYCFKVN